MSRRNDPPPSAARKPRGGKKPGTRKQEAPPRSGVKKTQAARKPGKPHAHAGFVDPHAEREAQRYEHPIPSREAILSVLAERGSLLRADAIAEALGIRDDVRREALDKRLRAMLRDGQLLESRRGGLAPAERIGLIAGTVLANAEGSGFLRTD